LLNGDSLGDDRRLQAFHFLLLKADGILEDLATA